MSDSLKHAEKHTDRETSYVWENLSEGWRELFCRSNNALTHFSRSEEDDQTQTHEQDSFPHWSLLAVEIEETDKEILVHVEIPGLEKEDCHITVKGNELCLYGEKRLEHKATKSTYHIMGRAYGTFQRSILLPLIVEEYKAEASYKNGVLTVCLPKADRKPPISIPVS